MSGCRRGCPMHRIWQRQPKRRTGARQLSGGDLSRAPAIPGIATGAEKSLEVAGVLSATGLTFLDTQADDTVYVNAGIDGATVTEFAADGPNIQVDINDPDGLTSVQRLYAWMQHYQTTAVGIASSFFGAMSAADDVNFTVDQSRVDLKLDNVSAIPLRVVGGHLSRKDGSSIIAASSFSIQMEPGKAYAVQTGISGLTPEESAKLTQAASNAALAAALSA